MDRMTELLLKRNVLHIDETPVSQLDPGRGKTKKAYLWVYRSNDLQAGPKIVVFDYRGGRSGEYARQFLGDWEGHLLVDDFSGYKALFSSERQEANPCIELGCWAHSRRKFFDLHNANGSSVALEALTRIGKLYEIEQQGKTLDIEARKQLRAGQSKAVLAELSEWLIETRAKTANGGGLAKALDYTLRRWSSLIRYADTGHLPIDNNPVENTIRPAAIGKEKLAVRRF